MKKMKLTVLVPKEIAAMARDAVLALSGPPARLTLACLAENALRNEIERLQKRYHQGKPFPSYKGVLRGGRPIKK